MSYYFLHKQRTIPTLLAYSVIAGFTILLAIMLRSLRVQTVTRAAPLVIPKQLIVSNITNTSAAIAIELPEPATVAIRFTNNGTEQLAFDQRDTRSQQARRIHSITLNNLQPSTTYSFDVLINGKKLHTYDVTTFSNNDVFGNQPPIFGKVVQKNLKPYGDVLVQLRFPDINKTQTYTAITNASGSWIIAVPIVKSDKGELKQLEPDDTVELRFTDGQKTSLTLATVAQTAPLRTIILGQQYNLNTDDSVLGEFTQAATNLQKNLQILFPEEGSGIPSRFIRVRGIAKPNTTVTVSISPGPTASVRSDETGAWTYQNALPLLAGDYTLSAASLVEKTSSMVHFTVTKEGERVLGEATGSATITPSISPEATITPIATQIPQISQAPTVVPVSPSPAIPSTGSFNNHMLIIAASAFSLLGLVLLLY